MCAPVAVPLVIAGVGTAMSLYGMSEQQRAAKKAGKSQAKYYETLASSKDEDANRVIAAAGTQAKLVQDQGARDLSAMKSNVRVVSGAQRAAIAASGIGLDSVTAEDIALFRSHQLLNY